MPNENDSKPSALSFLFLRPGIEPGESLRFSYENEGFHGNFSEIEFTKLCFVGAGNLWFQLEINCYQIFSGLMPAASFAPGSQHNIEGFKFMDTSPCPVHVRVENFGVTPGGFIMRAEANGCGRL